MKRFVNLSMFTASLIFLTGCANLSLKDVYKNPTFKYESTKVSDVSFSQLSGKSFVSIDNANRYAIPVSELSAELWLEGKPWLSLSNDAISGLPASGSITVAFDWDLIYDQLLQRAAAVYERGQADFTLKLQPTLAVPVLGPQTLSWESDFSVPVPKVPKVKLADWSVSKLTFTSIEMLLDLEVTNPNTFSIAIKDWAAGLERNGRSLAGVSLRDSNVSAGQTSTQQVGVKLSLIEVGTSVFSALKSGSWPSDLGFDWAGGWSSPDLGFDLPSLAGQL